jgi:small conductance mechanosensitive channel
MSFYKHAKSAISPYIPKILISILIFATINILANYIITLIPNENLVYIQVKNIIYYSIYTFGIIFILINFGIETTTIIAFLGTIVIALCISFQSFLTNIVATFYILLNNLFNIGDNIKIGLASGIVNEFNLINTKLIDSNNQIITIPNNYFLAFPMFNNNNNL